MKLILAILFMIALGHTKSVHQWAYNYNKHDDSIAESLDSINNIRWLLLGSDTIRHDIYDTSTIVTDIPYRCVVGDILLNQQVSTDNTFKLEIISTNPILKLQYTEYTRSDYSWLIKNNFTKVYEYIPTNTIMYNDYVINMNNNKCTVIKSPVVYYYNSDKTHNHNDIITKRHIYVFDSLQTIKQDSLRSLQYTADSLELFVQDSLEYIRHDSIHTPSGQGKYRHNTVDEINPYETKTNPLIVGLIISGLITAIVLLMQ